MRCPIPRRTGGPSAAPPIRCWRRSAASSPGWATRRWARCGRSGTARMCSRRSIRQFAKNIERHVHRVIAEDPFHVSANTDPKGDRSKRPAGSGPGHAPPCGPRDRCRDRGARREVRDRGGLCQPGLHQADDRQLGRCAALGLCGRASSAISRIRSCGSSAGAGSARRRDSARGRTGGTIRCRTASTRSTRW